MRVRTTVYPFFALTLFLALSLPSFAATTDSRSLITQPVNESSQVTLPGNTRPEANPANDLGRVSDDFPMEHMLLQLKRSPEQEQALKDLIDQMHTAGSANYHRWLTPQQLGESFGPSAKDIETISEWLKAQGFGINVVYANHMVIDFSGNAGQVSGAFQTEIHSYIAEGETHFANASNPRIPSALAPAVAGVVSLHNFRPRMLHEDRSKVRISETGHVLEEEAAAVNQSHPEFTTGSASPYTYNMVPADLATIYNLSPLFSAGITGKGVTIAVLEDSDLYNGGADVTQFLTTFGLTQYKGSFTTVHPTGGSTACTDPGVISPNDSQSTIDVEWALAAAPGATVELVACKDSGTTFGGLIALQNLINNAPVPQIVTMSYGMCEALNLATSNSAYNTAYQSATALGISVFAAAGDAGGASCDPAAATGTTTAIHGLGVNGLASTPYNVAVGGTDFSDTFSGTNSTYWSSTNNGTTYGSALSYVPEIPWNDSCSSYLIYSKHGYAGPDGSSGPCASSGGLGSSFITTKAGGGGASSCYAGVPKKPGVASAASGSCTAQAKPSWQGGVLGTASDGHRNLPDVVMFAGDNVWGHAYVYCLQDMSDTGAAACTAASPGVWSSGGGTAFAASVMAGIQALVDQQYGAAQGNPNYVYYKLAAAEYGGTSGSGSSACKASNGNTVASSCVFYDVTNDVTKGDNDVPCSLNASAGAYYNCTLTSGTIGNLVTGVNTGPIAYAPTSGWDIASGLGSVNAYNLVTQWGTAGTASTTTLSSSSLSIVVSSSVTLTAIVTAPTTPFTGTVAFFSGGPAGTKLGSVSVGASSPSTVTLVVQGTLLTVGANSITAVYSAGNGNNASSTSAAVVVTVTPSATTTTLSASPTSILAAQTTVLTATVAPTGTSHPTGTVTFYVGSSAGANLGSGTLSSASPYVASVSVAGTALSVGANSIIAVYGGDVPDAGSTSSAIQVTVTQPATTTTLSASPTTLSGAVSTTTLTATITAASSDGSQGLSGVVTFFDGATELGYVNVSVAGLTAQAVLTVNATQMSGGSNAVTAVYGGSAYYAQSTSNIVPVTVQAITLSTAGTHNFGAVPVNSSVQYGVKVTNTSATAFAFNLSLSGAADFSQTNNCPATIAINGWCEIVFTYSPATPTSTVETATYSIAANGQIFSAGNGAIPANSGTLMGRGLPSSGLVLSVTSHNFGGVNTGSSSTSFGLLVQNINTFTVAPTFSWSQAGASPFAVTNQCPATMIANSSCSILVTFSPVAVGSFSDVLSVSGTAPINPSGTVTFTGTGMAASAFTVHTGGHNFLTVSVGNTSGVYGTQITNLTSDPIAVGGSLGDKVNFQLQANDCPAILAPNAHCAVSFVFTPKSKVFLQTMFTVTGTDTVTSAAVPLTINGTSTTISGITLKGTGN